MRTNLFPVCIVAISSLLYASKSDGQINDSTLSSKLSAVFIPGKLNNDSAVRLFNKNTQIGNLQPGNLNRDNLSTGYHLSGGFYPQTLLPRFKTPIFSRNHSLSFSKTGLSAQLSNTSSADNGLTKEYYSSKLSFAVSALGVPFSCDYSSNMGGLDNGTQLGFTSLKFDRDLFIGQIKKSIHEIVNPEEFFQKAMAPLYAKRDRAFNSLRNDITELLNGQSEKFRNKVKDRINLDYISKLGTDGLLKSIVEENRLLVTEKESLFTELEHKIVEQSTMADSLKTVAIELETLNRAKLQMAGEVQYLSKKWANNGVQQVIGGFEREKRALLDKLMNDPENILKIAKQKLNFRGIQKMLLDAKVFNIGTSGINQSRLGLSDALLKGVSAEFLKGNRFIAPVIGTQPAIKNIADFSYSNFNELQNIFTAALRMGRGDIQKHFSHFSFALYQPRNNQQFLPGGFSSASPKNFVTTFSKRINFDKSHNLVAEVSRSTMLYNRTSSGVNNGLKNLVNTDNLFENMGITLDYTGELEGIGLSEKLVVRYTGKEYNNLGNFSLVSGTKEILNDIKKYFLRRKLILNIRTNYREYEFSIDNRKWKSFSYMADVKWKVKKGEFVEIRYQPYFNQRENTQKNRLNSQSHRLAIRCNINRKVAKGLKYTNFIELALSRDHFYDFVQDKVNSNKFLSFTSLQTLTIGKQTLFVNITGNQAKNNGGYLYGNSSLSMDAGVTILATGNISFSSALVYSGTSHMYNQLAIRQSISALVGKRLVLDGFLHAGKNLFEQAYLRIPAVSGNLSISYNLK